MKTPVTSGSFRHHLAYSWWKYLLAAILSFVLVDLLYTVTAYRSPRDKVLGFYVYGYTNSSELTGYLDNVRETELSDMEEISSLVLMDDNTYGPMQMMVYLSAGEGDVYLLNREYFLTCAADGALLPLEDDRELLAMFEEAGISLQSGWRKNTETGETHLYGIPQDKLPGLSQYAYAANGYLCLAATGQNQENAAKLFRILCRDTLTAPAPSSEPEVQPSGP